MKTVVEELDVIVAESVAGDTPKKNKSSQEI